MSPLSHKKHKKFMRIGNQGKKILTLQPFLRMNPKRKSLMTIARL